MVRYICSRKPFLDFLIVEPYQATLVLNQDYVVLKFFLSILSIYKQYVHLFLVCKFLWLVFCYVLVSTLMIAAVDGSNIWILDSEIFEIMIQLLSFWYLKIVFKLLTDNGKIIYRNFERITQKLEKETSLILCLMEHFIIIDFAW